MKKSRKLERFKALLFKYKNQIIATSAIIILALITLYVSYAYYNVTDEKPIIGGQVGDIADLEVRIMAQNRDALGQATDGYSLYPYIPRAGYTYNRDKSYCTNNAIIDYDEANFKANITAKKMDICYLYFDSTDAILDITLNLYAQNLDTDGNPLNTYTKLTTKSLPIGYTLNTDSSKTKCQNGSKVTYDPAENMLYVDTDGKEVCDVYMDALDVDIKVDLYLETALNSGSYKKANEIPSNVYYEKSSDTSKFNCTGNSTIDYQNQELVINAVDKTKCVAYLNVANGPIAESSSIMNKKGSAIINFQESNLGTNVTKWHYSLDGQNFTETTDNSVSLDQNVDNLYFYGEDQSGHESRIIETNGQDYIYNGLFNYSSTVQTKQIEQSGYYKLEVWGAQGGSYNKTYAEGGKGGYSVGTVYLEAGTNLFVHTGGSGSYNASLTTVASGGVNGGGNASYHGGTGGGATDIRINADDLYARVLVAGGGGGAYTYNNTYKAAGGYAGGVLSGVGNYLDNFSSWAGKSASLSSGGLGGVAVDSAYNGGAGIFGEGGSTSMGYNDASLASSGAGGGGFYGGGAGANANDFKKGAAGAGGSGYAYSESTAKYYPSGCLLNESYYLINSKVLNGNTNFLDPFGNDEKGHSGSGYAKITYLGPTLS